MTTREEKRKAYLQKRRLQRALNGAISLVICVLVTLLVATACTDDTVNTVPETSKPTMQMPSTSEPSTEGTHPETGPSTEPETETSAPTESIEPEEIVPEWRPDQESIDALAKTLWGECRGVKSKAHQAAVAWCVLNRVDTGHWGNTVLSVVSAPYQFSGYKESFPVTDELAALAEDVLIRWHAEKEGQTDVGRVLPKEYIYFVGDGTYNYFAKEWRSKDYWDWSLPTPYKS